MTLKGLTPEEQERRKTQSENSTTASNGKVTLKNGIPNDSSREIHFDRGEDGDYKLKYTVVKFNPKDTSEINALIADLQDNVGLRDVSAADMLMMLVNRYRYQRSLSKDKTQL